MAYDMQRDFKVIDDTNFQEQISAISSGDRMAGYNPRDYVVSPFTTTPTLGIIRDRKVIVELAIERDRKKQTPDHMHILGGVPILDQNGIPYCWYYGAVGAMMTCYAIQGGFVPHLSATSGAAKIKNYREQGGWAKEALTHERGIQAIGVGELRLWPEHQNDRRYDTPELRENAMMHKV